MGVYVDLNMLYKRDKQERQSVIGNHLVADWSKTITKTRLFLRQQ